MKTKKPDVLVLNRNFCAIHIISWQRCMSLLIQESARAMDRDFITYELNDWFVFSEVNEDYPVVHTVTRRIAIPEIILLRKYDRLPIREVRYSRQTLFQRDKFRCAYCGHTFERKSLTVDHVVPRAKGGTTTWDNTVSSCFECNTRKADRTPEEAKMKMHFHPKKPQWIGPLSEVKHDHMLKSWYKFTHRVLID